MAKPVKRLVDRYLFTTWSFILTAGLVLSLLGLQKKTNEAYEVSKQENLIQNISFCRALTYNNQVVIDILGLLATDDVITQDMTQAQKETIENLNRRRAGYRVIADDMVPIPPCADGYVPKSRIEEITNVLGTSITNTTVPSSIVTTTTIKDK